MALILAAAWDQSAVGPVLGPHGWQLVLNALANACCTTSAYLAMVFAPQYVTSAEVGLVLLLEAVFAPVWVFLAFGDVPSMWTFIGGGLLLATLAGHELAGAHAARKAGRAAASATGAAESHDT